MTLSKLCRNYWQPRLANARMDNITDRSLLDCQRCSTMVAHNQDPWDRLKILVSAVQSRPCPPCVSTSCPPRKSLRIEFVPGFVPISGTLWSIPAHVNQEPRAIQYPLEGRFALAGSLRGARDDSLGQLIGGSEKNRVVRRSIR